jgi:RNA polymerase primary sigma factor
MPEPTNDRAPHLLRAYLRSIARIPALGAEQASRLLRELRRLRRLAETSGSVRDFDAWQEVKHNVVVSHLRLVVGCSFRWRHCGVPLLDLIQEGNLGLMHAADCFDPDRRVRFSTYAVWWIRRNILRAIESQRRTVRLPSHVCALEMRTRRMERELCVRLGRKPGVEELAAELCVSPEVLDDLGQVAAGSVSIDRVSNATGVALDEMLTDPSATSPDAPVVRSWARRAFARGLSGIDERARRILTLRWGLGGALPMTLTEVGRRMGLSGERVRQIEKATLERLRRCRDLEKLLGVLE